MSRLEAWRQLQPNCDNTWHIGTTCWAQILTQSFASKRESNNGQTNGADQTRPGDRNCQGPDEPAAGKQESNKSQEKSQGTAGLCEFKRVDRLFKQSSECGNNSAVASDNKIYKSIADGALTNMQQKWDHPTATPEQRTPGTGTGTGPEGVNLRSRMLGSTERKYIRSTIIDLICLNMIAFYL